MRLQQVGIIALGILATLSLGAQSNSNSEAVDQFDSNSVGTLSRCPADMQLIANAYCIDRYEASTAELTPDGKLVAHSPFLPVEGLRVKAVSQKSVIPQAYISRN